MNFILSRLIALRSDTEAQDLMEYALTAAFIAVAVAGFFPTSIAPNISGVFSKVVSSMSVGGS